MLSESHLPFEQRRAQFHSSGVRKHFIRSRAPTPYAYWLFIGAICAFILGVLSHAPA